MAAPDTVLLKRRSQSFQRVLPNRLQELIAREFGARRHQGFVDEMGHEVQDIGCLYLVARAHGLGRRERPASGENGESLKNDLFGRRQQVVAPVDAGAHRLLARQCGPVAAGQDAKAIDKPRGDLIYRQCAHARRRKFERQRYAIQVVANLRHRRCVLLGQAKGGLHRERSILEQSHRLASRQGIESQVVIEVRRCEWHHRIRRFATDVQRHAARGHDFDTGTGLENPVDQIRAGLDQMLAVVLNQKQPPVLGKRVQRLFHRSTRFLPDAEHRCHGLRHDQCIGNRSQLDEPDPIGEVIQHFRAQLQRQARLSQSARTDKRQQPRVWQQAAKLGQFRLASDKRRGLLRQIVGCGLQ